MDAVSPLSLRVHVCLCPFFFLSPAQHRFFHTVVYTKCFTLLDFILLVSHFLSRHIIGVGSTTIPSKALFTTQLQWDCGKERNLKVYSHVPGQLASID